MSQCPDCNTEMVYGVYPIEFPIGRHIVVSRGTQHERCPACGAFILDARVDMLLELTATQVLLHDVKALDPKVLKFARKVLGLTQKDLALVLDTTQETISRYETGSMTAPVGYHYMLAGLIGFEVRKQYDPTEVRVLTPVAA